MACAFFAGDKAFPLQPLAPAADRLELALAPSTSPAQRTPRRGEPLSSTMSHDLEESIEIFDLDRYGDARVTAVILARNEERTIGSAVTGAAAYVHEVIVMDGHSTDRTAEVARAAGARVQSDPGRGKGSAIRASLGHARSDIVVFMDADGSHDPADIPKLVFPVLDGETDLCVGSRFSGGSDELSVSLGQLVRTIGNISMNIAINTRWGTELTDTLNGFRAAYLPALRSVDLQEDRHTIEQEMVMKLLRHGYRVQNVPTHEYPRKFGESHIDIWREWPLFVWCVITNIARKNPPRRFVQLPAAPLQAKVRLSAPRVTV